MKSIKYEALEDYRPNVNSYLSSLKSENKKIIDVGGAMGCWTYPYIDAVVDINAMDDSEKIVFQGNICDTDIWDKLEEYTNKNGVFDFSVCSHTLEDISSPYFVCKKLEKISKAGVIMVPSKYYELSRYVEVDSVYRGWIHHRWIWNIEDENLVGYPKLNLIEHIKEFDTLQDKMASDNKQIVLYWENNIPIKLVNDDYLGPSIGRVYELYHNLLND